MATPRRAPRIHGIEDAHAETRAAGIIESGKYSRRQPLIETEPLLWQPRAGIHAHVGLTP